LTAIRFLLGSTRAVHFHITHAPTLASALTRLGAGTDVVLLDLTLPDSQGLPTLRRLRAQDPETPVIVLARPEDRPMAVEALGLGAQDYLVKGQADSYLLGQTILRRVEPVESATQESTRTRAIATPSPSCGSPR
jgi:DNA-binding response OmpR family regulator